MAITVSFTSLGCDKNLVDSEVMLGLINDAGYQVIADDSKADVIIINTCSFINDAKQESIDNIIELGEYKQTGNCKVLIVTGCLAQRYKGDVIKELPEVDAVVGTGSYEDIIDVIKEALDGKKVERIGDINFELTNKKRIISTPGYYEYLKIAEGCNNHCTYCIIPKIRGKYRSKDINMVIEEAKELAKNGVSELLIVAQDTTKYGIDLYDKKMLPTLLKELCKIDGIEWIRLLYCYPEEITDELIEVMATEDKICNYVDMPIQHSNTQVLKRMARRSTKEELLDVISNMRKRIPDIAIRTTLITGFPGETEEEFDDMYEFVKEVEFDRLGVFSYSQEEDTKAAEMDDQVDDEIKEYRKDKIMMLQKGIAENNAKKMVGKQLRVMIDGKLPEEDDVYCGRSYKDAPDIDGIIFVKTGQRFLSGDIVDVKIVGSFEYDLIGEVLDEYSK